ncbi:MAG TPA: hypothetical protein VFL83_19060 [Anaeromyxobacter sp.]|nr:hypothetical protein [Anaeromyxobacter sp.]
MTSRLSKLVLAAALAAALPVAAAADGGCDHDRGAPPYYRAEAGPRRWREAEWRERRLERIRAELRALDADRAEFHARNAWNPRRLRRYDRWYAERRAELVHRYAELEQQHVAWR